MNLLRKVCDQSFQNESEYMKNLATMRKKNDKNSY